MVRIIAVSAASFGMKRQEMAFSRFIYEVSLKYLWSTDEGWGRE